MPAVPLLAFLYPPEDQEFLFEPSSELFRFLGNTTPALALCGVFTSVLVLCRYMRATGGSSRVMCDNVPGLVSRQRQLCHRHPDVMRAIGLGVAEWTAECQHQFRQHRWNCNTLDRDHSLFGRVLLRSKSPAFMEFHGAVP